MCVSRSRTVTGRRGWAGPVGAAIGWSRKAGTNFATGSSSSSLPSSTSINTPIAVIGFVIEAIQKTASRRIGRRLSMSARPKASRAIAPRGATTKVTAPANSPWSCSSCSA